MVSITLDSLLPSLKPRQLESIKNTQAPQLILAGAGKTTTITAKIAYMVEKENIDPSHILALTFSKEVARNPCVSVSTVTPVDCVHTYASALAYVDVYSAQSVFLSHGFSIKR